ncbi:rod shape-determining protein MreC [Nocardioides sp.]|uniref:rod shape-determining protein MreC n=1 Tax=Nocardioides sp. TaxID=35761 RepID=UPI002735B891|nr:rod shape-determining protein MreC [Nocardioides sp.]MDP3891483.1 rod shape-determining protein MreC [Nocardioides sp.]
MAPDRSGPPGRERRWRTGDRDDHTGPSRPLVAALVLACATLVTLDSQGGGSSPLEPARSVVGEALGPAQSASAAAVRPFTAVPSWLRGKNTLQRELNALEAENARLRQEARTAGLDRNRLAELDQLTRAAADTGYALVPARVVAFGPMQSFSRTVTIDAGSAAGVGADMTVVNNDGLVGRVVRVTRTTATVLLVLDADSVVGGRVGDSMEIGFLRGRGVVSNEGRLDLELVDETVVPSAGDTVVTWGSEGGSPYVAGIPIGSIDRVVSTPRETSQRAVIDPFVDFTALDLVGVVVASGTTSDRAVIEADGSVG